MGLHWPFSSEQLSISFGVLEMLCMELSNVTVITITAKYGSNVLSLWL